MNKTTFGIGCFHFWLCKTTPYVFKDEEYVKELKQSLENIKAVSNVQIDFEKGDTDVEITEPFGNLSDGEDFFPIYTYARINFDLYIPFRLQEKILEDSLPLETFSENFRLDIRYGYEAPVCFVEPLNPTALSFGSKAVVLVRRYLEKEINEQSKTIRFDSLGPSPFHSDCYLSPASSKEQDVDEFKLTRIEARGYDTLHFEYSRLVFRTSEEAKDKLFEIVTEELSLFYGGILIQAKAMSEWEKNQDLLTQLIKPKENTNLAKRIITRFRRGRIISDIHAAIAELEGNQILREIALMTNYRSTYVKDEHAFFQTYVDDLRKENVPYPTQQVSALIQFLEGRRSRAIEMFVVLASAIIGGVVGSVLTLLFTSKP
jgi:hypothetical protein